jgi:hypothetical protein
VPLNTQNDHYSIYFYLGNVKDHFHIYTRTHIHSFKHLLCLYNCTVINCNKIFVPNFNEGHLQKLYHYDTVIYKDYIIMTLKLSTKPSHFNIENHYRKLSHSDIENRQRKLSHSDIINEN